MKPPRSVPLRYALWPFSLLYRAATGAHRAAYDLGLLAREHVPVPVVSVGNLTVGGTGKTPLVALICTLLEQEGIRTAVVSRGYKRRGAGDVTVVSRGDGEGPRIDVRAAGDEPYWLARSLPRSAVVVAARRAQGARLAVTELGAQAIVTDDGYQHHRLARDLDLLVMDAACPVDSGWVLPAGALREPPRAASRASALILAQCDPAGGCGAAEALFRRHNRRAPVFHSRARPVEWIRPDGGRRSPADLAGQSLAAFCGIGRPHRFLEDLRRAGAEVPVFVPFPDHHWYTDQDLRALSRRARAAGATEWITTEKDFVRLSQQQLQVHSIGRLRIAVEIQEEQEFRSLLMSALQAEVGT